ncbi:MAG: hypothetical protein ABH858_07635 [Candidatus Omnitrophota bacterium]
MSINIDIILLELKRGFYWHFINLKQFRFSQDNPVFWLLLLLLFFVLRIFWKQRKSFYFCIVFGAILLANTKIEAVLANTVNRPGVIFDPLLLRLFSAALILFILSYYIFIKADD